MGIRINHLQNIPVMVLEAVCPMRVPDDMGIILSAINQFRAMSNEHLYQIYDMRGVDLLFSDMIITAVAETLYDYGDINPEITTILVGDYAAIAFSEQYIPTDTYLFASLDEALDFVLSLNDHVSLPSGPC